MLAAYRACLNEPHVKYLFASNLLGRMPNGMAPLGIALFLRSHEVGFGRVGAITALFGLSTAVGGPMLGRAVDRWGQLWVLCVSAIASSLGFLLLVGRGEQGFGTAAAAVVVAGVFSPPLEPCLRTIWPAVLRDPGAISTAYALDASLQEVVFVTGPLLVVLIGSIAGSGPALVVTAVAMLLGSAAYVIPRPVRVWRAGPRQSDWAGALRSHVLRRLLVVLAGLGIGLGALNIVTVAYQEHIGRPGFSGVLLGANAVGALVGGLYYGARQWRTTGLRQLQYLLAGMTLSYLTLVAVPQPVLAVVLVFCAGLFLSPALACSFAVIGESALAGTATEAFAWMVTAVLAGNALGAAVTGSVEQHLGLHASFLVPGLAGAVAVTVTAAFLRTARQPAPPAVRAGGTKS
ncbi:MFS transporter [Streptomyces sulfonofaciens]|uniref:MFS transporter n=1 Tax=Streptomyces sulfonofaciens TaxID=68272 RepID=A0A919L7G4_9ACTN|nr:MFS transporter [Streptomyces sulfonofaciens]GHH87700.1 MFS transporter [Streptomyces sulfonofaciens]